ncbi:MAG: hypothetical protein H6858_06375 [Rhodospirillales bacterium]|nr:hypothetical protein [Alphaproteobacteria bacterium]MCB1839355.1 hypothetical protein [Alphaproteobacteria bacterium]MCB9977204.1 hypothetical protein [Rhodospirillales bacterium]
MDEDFLLSLPDDPEEAFPIYEKKAREIYTEYNDMQEYFDEEAYFCDIIGFIQAADLDIGLPAEMPTGYNEYEQFQQLARNKIRIFASKSRYNSLKKKKESVTPSYVMTPAIREEIHGYIRLIREALDKLDSLGQEKREILFKRLDAFATEVNKNRTKIESLGSAYTYAMKTLGDGAEPVIRQFERIFKAIGKAEEEKIALPKVEEKKQITYQSGSKKTQAAKIEDFEEEIPF